MKKILCSLLALVLSFSAMADVAEERKEITDMRQEILTRLYKEEPSIKDKIANASGYATFSNIGINLFLISTGRGSGIVKNNGTGKESYMKMFSGGLGVGLGVKDFSAVFVFHSNEALNAFMENGWDFSAQADAAAKSGEKGDEGSASGTAVKGVEIFQLTESGLALQATLQGTKFWIDDDLN